MRWQYQRWGIAKTMMHRTTISSCLRRVVLAPATLLILLAALFSIQNNAKAEGMSLLINGISFHKNAPQDGGEFNERNWGLGLQHDWGIIKKHWAPYFTISALKDSHKRNSFYAGGGALRRFPLDNIHEKLHFDAGLIGFMMTRKDHHNRKPFIGVLPALSLGTDKIAINATYIPEVEPKLSALWFFQLKVSLSYFNSTKH